MSLTDRRASARTPRVAALRSEVTSFASPDKRTLRRFFDDIAGRYDFLNTFLSLRLDDYWRKRSCGLILEGHERSLLDLGTGTGKFLALFLKRQPWNRAVGLDFSSSMLRRASETLPANRGFVAGDFHELPFRPETFDLVVSSFALRSVKQMPRFLAEVYRLLTDSGKAAFLCLTRPRNRWWKMVYAPYLNFYLPLMGRLISGNGEAYQFLSQSIQAFQEPEETAAMIRAVGFRSAVIHSLTFGAATLIVAKK